MATGVTKGESKRSAQASARAVAVSTDGSLTVRNSVGSVDRTQFANDMRKGSIATEFVRIDRSGKAESAAAITPNSLCICDNQAGMSVFSNTHAGKVKLIYADPPYGTGFEFQSRSMSHAYDDHDNDHQYVETVRQRLILCRELLSDEGTLYLHIGHQLVAELKIVLDEIFGKSNFRNLITRKKCSSKNSTHKSYPNLNDFVLFYSKTKNYQFVLPSEEPTADWLAREYPKEDAKGRYKLVPVHAPGIRNGETGSQWRGQLPPPGKHWQYTPSKLDELDAKGEMHWSKNGNPRRKVYLSENKRLPRTDYWSNFRDAHHQSIGITGYPTEKNLEMLKMIVKAGTSAGDLVLDPYCGSGTTLHAADDLGRHWVGMDQSRTAAQAAVWRLRRGLSRMGDYVNGKSLAEAADLFDAPSRSFEVLVDRDLYSRHEIEYGEIAAITPVAP